MTALASRTRDLSAGTLTIDGRSMRRGGRGVMVTSHILADIDELCDRLLFIRDRDLEEVAREQVANAGERRSCASLYRKRYGSEAARSGTTPEPSRSARARR